MAITWLVALSLVILLGGVIVYGIAFSQKAESKADKNFRSRYFVILVITFAAGGIARTIEQNTGQEWLNGLVAICLGLYIALFGIPFFWRISKDKIKGLKGFLLFLPGLLFALLGLGLIYLGVTQVWDALLQ